MKYVKCGSFKRSVSPLYRIGLVGCVKKKRKVRSRAKDLYISDLFIKARRYSEKHYNRWFILSAKYHLVEPDTYIEPYDETLNEKTRTERLIWSETVFHQIKGKLRQPSSFELYFHAGIRYREFLIPLLVEAEYTCKVPLEHLKIGEQLAWYKRHLK
jgi:hypothetical protein